VWWAGSLAGLLLVESVGGGVLVLGDVKDIWGWCGCVRGVGYAAVLVLGGA